jgi:hypothetical protein
LEKILEKDKTVRETIKIKKKKKKVEENFGRDSGKKKDMGIKFRKTAL